MVRSPMLEDTHSSDFVVPLEYRALLAKPRAELAHYRSFQENELFKLHRQLFAIALLEHCRGQLDSLLTGLTRAAPEYLDLAALEQPALESYKSILSAKKSDLFRDVAAIQLMEWYAPTEHHIRQQVCCSSVSESSKSHQSKASSTPASSVAGVDSGILSQS